MRELTRLYYRVRYDGSTVERNVRGIAQALLGDVKAAFRQDRVKT